MNDQMPASVLGKDAFLRKANGQANCMERRGTTVICCRKHEKNSVVATVENVLSFATGRHLLSSVQKIVRVSIAYIMYVSSQSILY